MLRLVILFVIGYIFIRALKSWMFTKESSRQTVSRRAAGEVDAVMIKDPQCDAYFPRRNGVHLKFEGKDLYFCSHQCREEYIAAHSKGEA